MVQNPKRGHARVQQQQNCQSRCKPPTPSHPSGRPPSASSVMEMIALPRSASRCRCRRAAAARHWRSKQPPPPSMGRVGCSERPAVSNAAARCCHAVWHASAHHMNAAIAAVAHAVADSRTRCQAWCHGGSRSVRQQLCHCQPHLSPLPCIARCDLPYPCTPRAIGCRYPRPVSTLRLSSNAHAHG